MPLGKAFKYLDMYEELPPQLKTRWYLIFAVHRGDRAAPDVRPTMVLANGQRVPLVVDAAAQIQNAPNLATVKSSAYLEIDPSAHLISEIRPVMPVTTHVDGPALEASLAQVSQAIAHIAGAFAAIAPKFDCALFPDSAGGVAVMADGRSLGIPSLPVREMGQVPCFQTAAGDGLRALNFTRPPSRILLTPKPRP